MINFKDFTPEVIDKGGLFRLPTLEELSAAVSRANEWIAANDIQVVNIETVVLPNIHNPGEQGSTDVQLHTSGELHSYWHQFIRVWCQSS